MAKPTSRTKNKRPNTKAGVSARTKKRKTATKPNRPAISNAQRLEAMSGDWLWETDDTLHVTFISDGFKTTTGNEKGLLLGKTLAEIVLGDSRIGTGEGSTFSLQDRPPFSEIACSFFGADERAFHFALNGIPIFADDDTFTGYRGSARNISYELDARKQFHNARKKVEAINTQSRTLDSGRPNAPDTTEIYAVLDSMHDGVVTIDSHGVIQFVNKAAEKIFGYEQNEIILRNISSLMPEQEGNQHNNYIAAYEKTGKSRIVDTKRKVIGKRKNGKTFPMDLSLSKTNCTKGSVYVGVMRDLSKKENRHKTPIDDARHYQVGVEGSLDGIWDWNIDTDEVFISNAIQTLFNIKTTQTYAANLIKKITPDDRDRFRQTLSDFLQSNADVFSCEFKINGPKRKRHCIAMRGSASRNANGEINHMAGSMRDITARVERFETITKERRRIEEISNAKSELMATVSRELRAPINSMIGFSDLLLTGIHGELGHPLYKSYAKDLNLAGTQLLEFTRIILDISDLQTGRFTLQSKKIDPSFIAREATQAAQPIASRSKNKINLRTGNNIPKIMGDPQRIRQAIDILIKNAIHRAPNASGINVKVSATRNGLVTVTVCDKGKKMQPRDIDYALTLMPKYQNANKKSSQTSAAIGLYLCKCIAELHGGAIDITNAADGKGTCISLKFLPPRQK